ncbi:lysozyme [Flavobacterium sp.]|uniref:lysozyme n=1 Tax=Flavobacterium sp. TaxID=239 RepID=UPI003F698417
MKTNQEGIKILHEFEKCRLKAYLCPAKVWTIAWGNTFYADGSKVKEGDKITQLQADRLFEVILAKFESGVRNSLKVTLTQNQFSALVSFAYNVGLANFRGSTLLRKININPNDPSIASEFLRWVNKGSAFENGLRRRRSAESDLYFK